MSLDNEVKRARAEEVAADLQGTCRDLNEFATEAEQQDAVFLEAIDELIFHCTICGWWCEICEMAEGDEHDDQICTECHEG